MAKVRGTRIGPTLMGVLDFDARYAVDGWGGIAWYLEGYAKEEIPFADSDYLICGFYDVCETCGPVNNPNCFKECVCECHTHEHIDSCWTGDIDAEPQFKENKERVIAVMVGDDRRFEFGIDELLRLDENQYCTGCGQIGPPCAGWEM